MASSVISGFFRGAQAPSEKSGGREKSEGREKRDKKRSAKSKDRFQAQAGGGDPEGLNVTQAAGGRSPFASQGPDAARTHSGTFYTGGDGQMSTVPADHLSQTMAAPFGSQRPQGHGSPWACAVCTLENDPGASVCMACGSERPPSGSGGFAPSTGGGGASGQAPLPPQNTLDFSDSRPPQHTLNSGQVPQTLDPRRRGGPQDAPDGRHVSRGDSFRSGASGQQPPAGRQMSYQSSLSMTQSAHHREQQQSYQQPPHNMQTTMSAQQMQQQAQQMMQQQERQEMQHGTISQRMHSDAVGQGSIASGRLRLRVLRAFNLRNTDLGILPEDVSDPFVVARVGRQEFKTEVIDNDLNPVWNSPQFEFAIESDDAKLVLEVFNSNQWHANDSLGKMEIRIQALTPGENHTVLEPLDEGEGIIREDGLQARLEVEVKFLSPEQLAGVSAGNALARRAGASGAQATPTQAQHHKAPNWVPLPNFNAWGPEAFAAPKKVADDAPIGQNRRMQEYESMACRLGQYDYSKEAVYYPKQDEVDKRQWKEDPFYGWRRDLQKQEHHMAPEPVGRGGRPIADRGSPNPERDMTLWQKDPFHGWLKHDLDGQPEAGLERMQEARVARELMALPSFKEAPTKRFEDHREYVDMHKVQQRPRQGASRGGRGSYENEPPLEQNWKDDAFFGWLPGRGRDDEQKHKLHRPLEQARLSRLPSFSEAAALGISGHGIGVLSIWINGALGLAYSEGSGLRGKPSSCVRVRVGNGEEKVTSTVPVDTDPRWNSPAMVFEVESTTDKLLMEVMDLANPRGDAHVHQYFLGRLEFDVSSVMDMAAEAASRQQRDASDKPLHLREPLQGSQRRGAQGQPQEAQLDFEILYEPYDTEVERARPRRQREARGGHHLSRNASFRSTASSDLGMGRNMLGTLSVKIIQAYDLINTDTGLFGDVSDPYVSLRLASQTEKQRKRTATIDNDLNPVWNTTPFLFPIAQDSDSLMLEVYDEDMLTSDDFLGRLTIPLYKIIHGQPNVFVRIRDRLQDIQHGELEVELGFSPD